MATPDFANPEYRNQYEKALAREVTFSANNESARGVLMALAIASSIAAAPPIVVALWVAVFRFIW